MLAIKNVLVSIALTLPMVGLGGNIDWKSDKWSFVQENEGIKVYKKSFAGNPITGVGGEGIINAPMGKIVWVLMDNAHKSDWVDKFMDARTLATPSPKESIQYGSFKMPLIVDNRDFVYKYTFRSDKNILIVDVVSVTHPDADPKDTVGVRGNIVMGQYTLKPLDGGKRTFVQVKYLADPKGLLPNWVVNVVQKTWPLKTLQGLQRQVKKPFVKDHPMIGNQFQTLLSH